MNQAKAILKLFELAGDVLMSRSEAKRLLFGLEVFHEVVLDFQGVQTVGQGFADEVFRVFAKQHPHIKLHAINCHENVQFMIDRAQKPPTQKTLA